jgi:hypothetical protein
MVAVSVRQTKEALCRMGERRGTQKKKKKKKKKKKNEYFEGKKLFHLINFVHWSSFCDIEVFTLHAALDRV